MKARTHFDSYAESYDRVLDEALRTSGENREFFARGRVSWLDRCLHQMGVQPRHVLDYGCGIGATAPLCFEILGAESVAGVDESLRSLEAARREYGNERAHFFSLADYEPAEAADLAYCNGVFHHIREEQRSTAAEYVFKSLRPEGLFALWENNPWNPGTRYVMAHCEFDRDAVPISALEARRLLRSAGFEVLRTDFLFVFPRFLRVLRPLESLFVRLPLGAQYQVLCRKPA